MPSKSAILLVTSRTPQERITTHKQLIGRTNGISFNRIKVVQIDSSCQEPSKYPRKEGEPLFADHTVGELSGSLVLARDWGMWWGQVRTGDTAKKTLPLFVRLKTPRR